jgi:molecular chaperone DnaK
MAQNKQPERRTRSYTIGIDLGTTNSCVAIVEDGQPQVLTSSEGKRTTPSVVSYFRGDERVGEVAKRHAALAPKAVLFSIKRIIGRRVTDPEVVTFSNRTGIDVVLGADGDARIVVEIINNETLTRDFLSPIQVSARVLRAMKEAAEQHIGSEVANAVITVPAYFNDAQRNATLDAGRVAGLNVRRIINEPTAAALAYGLQKHKQGIIVVYDFGGGTFDVSALRITDGVFEVIASDGDNYLGGDDLDNALVAELADRCLRDHGRDPREDPIARVRLREDAEKAKINLSGTSSTEVDIPFILTDVSFHATVTRKELERLAMPLVVRASDVCRRLLKDAKLATTDIDHLVLVGGMTRMPLIQDEVAKLFGRKPSRDINPDEVVAVGAAVQGAILDEEMGDVLILDVAPLSLGVDTKGDIFSRVIERNTVIPTTGIGSYVTTEDDVTSLYFAIYQGEREIASENYRLGAMKLDGIPPLPRGVAKIRVTFDMNENGVLSASALDMGSGRSCSVRIEHSGSVGQAEIERMIQQAASHAAADRERRRLAELRNSADDVLYQANKLIGGMPPGKAEFVSRYMDVLRDTIASTDPEKIEQQTFKLRGAIDG